VVVRRLRTRGGGGGGGEWDGVCGDGGGKTAEDTWWWWWWVRRRVWWWWWWLCTEPGRLHVGRHVPHVVWSPRNAHRCSQSAADVAAAESGQGQWWWWLLQDAAETSQHCTADWTTSDSYTGQYDGLYQLHSHISTTTPDPLHKTCHYIFASDFAKYRPIFKILSVTDLAVNL